MNQSFKVGDLACVVRTCCAEKFAETGGRVGAIAWIGTRKTACWFCGAKNIGVHAASALDRPGVPLPWLKRIDPHPGAGAPSRPEAVTVPA